MSEVPSVFPCFRAFVLSCFRHFVTLFCPTSEFYPERLPGGARQNPRSGFFLVTYKVEIYILQSTPILDYILEEKNVPEKVLY